MANGYKYLEPTFKTIKIAENAIKEIVEPFMKKTSRIRVVTKETQKSTAKCQKRRTKS